MNRTYTTTEDIDEKLQELKKLTDRSKSGVIRYLIDKEYKELTEDKKTEE